MENNCFINSDVPVVDGSATVLVTSGATVSSVNNFVSQETDVLTCPFVGEVNQDYDFMQCNAAVAGATVCGSDSPVAAPTADEILPSTLTTLQESGRDVDFFFRLAENSNRGPFIAATAVQIGSPLTAFVPLDSAFQSNVEFWNDFIDNPIWIDHRDCVVSYHLHVGRLTTPQWQYISTARTLLAGEVILLDSDPGTNTFFADGQALVDGGTDIATETGIIHYLAESPLVPSCLSVSIVGYLSGFGIFSTLLELAGIADLVLLLEETRPLTLFAPTDDAFAKLDADTLDFLKNNPEELREVLLYHSYLGNLYLTPALGSVDIPTPINATLALQVDPVTSAGTINGVSAVLLSNNLASNGIMHIIDTVLIPPTGEGTMAPATVAPATAAPAGTTMAPVTSAPVDAPTTFAPVTSAPIEAPTVAPVTSAPIEAPTVAPVTSAPIEAPTVAPVTSAPIEAPTVAPVTAAPIMPTPAPVMQTPTTASPVDPTDAPVTAAPVPDPPTSVAMTTAGSSGMLGLVIASVMFVFM
jgi:uncharacterized surface protein with fasciclin (FAS1) repeats